MQFSIVFVIHGDGNYLYHDTNGNEYIADEEAMAEAKKVALQNPLAEVFIFHQRPRQHFLLFFPVSDGEFYYYRNGQLIENLTYWRDQEQSQLSPEVSLYHRFHTNNPQRKASVFIYCGHEIPEFGSDVKYDESYPDRNFTVDDLASGLKEFTSDSSRFDLMILSTCFGGTPYTISKLGSFSRTIIASPDNLHLSYFDFHLLERLDLSLQDGDVPVFAKRFAQQSFVRLTKNVQTTVSVAVYDIDSVQEFLHSFEVINNKMLTPLKEKKPASLAANEHCDCADLPVYRLPTMNDGVTVFYRPARFGRARQKQNHSGWECWKDFEPVLK